MPNELLEIEGAWEEILAREPELRGKWVRVTVIPGEPEPSLYRQARGSSTGADLLKHAGTWVGDDLDERLEEAVRNRTSARF